MRRREWVAPSPAKWSAVVRAPSTVPLDDMSALAEVLKLLEPEISRLLCYIGRHRA